MQSQLAEMEEEQKALERLHREIEVKMGKPAPSNGFPSQLTPRERAEVDARSVYVGNVGYSVTATELEAHFRDCGSLNRVTIQVEKFTGHPKGFAFVEFQDRQSVTNALMLSDSLLKGRQIKVTEKRKTWNLHDEPLPPWGIRWTRTGSDSEVRLSRSRRRIQGTRALLEAPQPVGGSAPSSTSPHSPSSSGPLIVQFSSSHRPALLRADPVLVQLLRLTIVMSIQFSVVNKQFFIVYLKLSVVCVQLC